MKHSLTVGHYTHIVARTYRGATPAGMKREENLETQIEEIMDDNYPSMVIAEGMRRFCERAKKNNYCERCSYKEGCAR